MTNTAWDSVYLIGWYEFYDGSGIVPNAIYPHFVKKTDEPVEHFVVLGEAARYSFPLCNLEPKDGWTIAEVPKGVDPDTYARELKGFHAVGFRRANERKDIGDVLETLPREEWSNFLRALACCYCEHGRSMSGTCWSCDSPDDEEELEDEDDG